MTDTPAQAPRRDPLVSWVHGLSWTWLVALAMLVWLLTGGAAGLLRDADTFWHLAAGRWIAEHGAIPHVDPFSHSKPGAPWTAHEWLAEVLMHEVHQLAGWRGLLVAFALTQVATVARLLRFLLQRMEPVHALLVVALAATMSWSHWLARPHVLAWFCLVCWLCEWVDAQEQQRRPALWVCGLMAVWANLHGSFVLGVLLAGGVAAEAVWDGPRHHRLAQVRRWGLFLALAVLASLCTPHGWNSWLFTWQVMQMKVSLAIIGEWLSPNFQSLQLLEIWLLLAFALAMSGRLRLPLWRMLMLVGLVHLSLKHQRNIAMLGWIFPILCAQPWARQLASTQKPGHDAEQIDRLFRELARPASMAVNLIFVGLFGAACTMALMRSPIQPDDNVAIAPALAAARQAGATGHVLNDYSFGGYLIHEGVPVFIDGRADMYGDPFMQSYYDAISVKSRDSLVSLIRQYDINWAVLSPDYPVKSIFETLPGWQQVYSDAKSVVFIHGSTMQSGGTDDPAAAAASEAVKVAPKASGP